MLAITQCQASVAHLGSSRSSALHGRPAAAAPAAAICTRRPARRLAVVRAQAEDDDFEARLAALKKAKGETPYGEGKKAGPKPERAAAPAAAGRKKVYDYSNEALVFETPPHRGDLAVNVALGFTLLWLPLSVAAVGRGLFVKYRFTDRRISVITAAPWQNEQLDAAYEEVTSVVSIGRGVGAWGDMVVTLRDGSKIEMRSLPKFKEMEAYILARRDELTGGGSAGGGSGKQGVTASSGPKGFA